MDNKRVFLYLALGMVVLLLWQQWQHDYGPTLVAQPAASSTVAVSQHSRNETTNTNGIHKASKATMSRVSDAIVSVSTDVLNLRIDSSSGAIVGSSLVKYPEQIGTPRQPYVLFNTDPDNWYSAHSGIMAAGKKQFDMLQFPKRSTQYKLTSDEKKLTVPLTWCNRGLCIDKKITVHRGSYILDVSYTIHNKRSTSWDGQSFFQIIRSGTQKKKQGVFAISSYTGGAISDPAQSKYEKVKFKTMKSEDLSRTVHGGWIAMQEHYFLSAWVPQENSTNTFFTRALDNNLFTIGMLGSPFTVAPGKTYTVSSQLYVGPELPSVLKTIAPGLDLTIDYGFLWFIASPLFSLLKFLYSILGNWGWAIVGITILIKLAFYGLSAKSYRSMAGLRKIQPKIEQLKNRYGDDKQKMSQAMFELYKKEKINPLGGCLPIIVQIPFFIALYWVLLESVQLRHAPFIGWIHDLSVRDPYFILPGIMAVTMLIQQKLNPPPPDPMQAKLMMVLPVVFFFLFMNFPAGLVLYWVVNNTLSILQQWYITKQFEAGNSKQQPAV